MEKERKVSSIGQFMSDYFIIYQYILMNHENALFFYL